MRHIITIYILNIYFAGLLRLLGPMFHLHMFYVKPTFDMQVLYLPDYLTNKQNMNAV